MNAVNKAKDTLVRALDQLERAQLELGGEPERVDLVVIYSMGRDGGDEAWHEVGGWAATAGPKWVHAELLRRGAQAHDDAVSAIDDEEDEE